MSSPPEILSADVERTASADLEDAKVTKSIASTADLVESTPVPGFWTAFTGADRTALPPDPIVWSQGTGPFVASMGNRIKSIFTRRFL